MVGYLAKEWSQNNFPFCILAYNANFDLNCLYQVGWVSVGLMALTLARGNPKKGYSISRAD